jgi:hypothetical protein
MFPDNILLEIQRYLTKRDLFSWSLVSKQLRRLSADVIFRSIQISSIDKMNQIIDDALDLRCTLNFAFVSCLELSLDLIEHIFIGDIDTLLQIFSGIYTLNIPNAYGVTNTVLQSLSDHCHNIRQLTLSYASITDSMIPILTQKCPRLSFLDLSRTQISGNSLLTIVSTAENLHTLVLEACSLLPIDYIFFQPFKNTSLSKLQLKDSECDVPLLTHILSGTPELTFIDLTNSQNISDELVVALARQCTHISHIRLSECPFITNISLYALSKLALELAFLDISENNNVTSDMIQMLCSECDLLSTLVLTNCLTLSMYVQSKLPIDDISKCVLDRKSIRMMGNMTPTVSKRISVETPSISSGHVPNIRIAEEVEPKTPTSTSTTQEFFTPLTSSGSRVYAW